MDGNFAPPMLLSEKEEKALQALLTHHSLAALARLHPQLKKKDWEAMLTKILRSRRKGKSLVDEGTMWDNHADQPTHVLFVDGASEPERKTAGIGGIIYFLIDDGSLGQRLYRFSEGIGEATNNEAEYRALLRGVEHALALGIRALEIRSDSELLVRQLNGMYRVKHPRLVPLHARARAELSRLAGWKILHVPREGNREADRLSKEGLQGSVATPQ